MRTGSQRQECEHSPVLKRHIQWKAKTIDLEILDLPADWSYGDNLSISELYEEYSERLRRYATSLTRDTARADDLVQETFIQAMLHLGLLDGLNPYQRRGWLYQVLKNRFLDQQRAAKRRQALLEQMAQGEVAGFSTMNGMLPYELFDLAPERYRGLLRKRYIQGLTSDEIGRELGVPAATVRSRLRLAIEWLRSHQSEFM
jgi:RNA polymerase sigma-70 factor, ECF subfamily